MKWEVTQHGQGYKDQGGGGQDRGCKEEEEGGGDEGVETDEIGSKADEVRDNLSSKEKNINLIVSVKFCNILLPTVCLPGGLDLW